MKKLVSIFCSLIFISSQAQAASGLFIGVDALNIHALNKADNSSSSSGPQNGNKQDDTSQGYGANLGLRFDPLFLYVSAEVFYERLNSSTPAFTQITSTTGPNITMNDRYGAKGNLGMTIFPWFTPFITYGVASVQYNTSDSKRQTAPLYGVGILFDIPLTNFSIKAAYDVQRFKIPYQNAQSEVSLGVAHLGATYTF